MNKRIKQLVKQATEDVMKNTPSFLVTNEMWQEKFAELIVQAVFDKIEDERFEIYLPVKEAVKKHFGVEE